jgi:hypothetical protein
MPNNDRARSSIPPDNLQRKLSVTNADSPQANHVSVVGDTYTVLIRGRDTDGRYGLIDMLVPTGEARPFIVTTLRKCSRFRKVKLNSHSGAKRYWPNPGRR